MAYCLPQLYRYANRPDQNLGRAEPGPSLCRITLASAEALMAEFLRTTWPCREPPASRRTFIDLGCGRGLVCAAALEYVPGLVRTIGWDIDEEEIRWAQRHLGYASAEFHNANALDFCLAEQVPPLTCDSVWIYAFWKDWLPDTKRRIARHLFLEDLYKWPGVFACSTDKDALWQLIADQDDESTLELLDEAYKQVGAVHVTLSGSGERHTIYLYARQMLF